jgi:radical SAM protein with 4Fe4S-binding SPASM domain
MLLSQIISMNLTSYPYIPPNIVLRKYREYDIYDLRNDESYIIDQEAYILLKYADGLLTIQQIIEKFPKRKRDEVREGIEQFHELGIIRLANSEITDNKIKSLKHFDLPNQNPFDPPYLKNLMINITERCNLTCKHCYITEKNKVDMPLNDVVNLIEEFDALQGIRVILTGGEPFLYSQLEQLLKKLIDISLQKVILTNGVLVDDMDEKIFNLLEKNFIEVYVSVDGLEQTHNDFRNARCFEETIRGISALLDRGISVSINTMIHKQNIDEFGDLYQLITDLGEIKNWSIDIPTFGEEIPEEIKQKYEISYKQGGKILKNYGWGIIYETPLEGQKVDYSCGPYLMAVDVLGNISKCGFTFFGKPLGNVFKLGLKKSWKLVQKNLNWSIQELECAKIDCEYLDDCRGGCRFRAKHHTGYIYGVDSYKCYQFGKLKD